MSVEGQPAWVLHRRPYRETSALLELFTEAHGRVGAVARGAQRRGWGGLLEPFIPLQVGWSGRGELKSLQQVEQAGAGCGLRGNALACGFYMAELLLALLRRDEPSPRSWVAYTAAIDGLSGAQWEPALRGFEVTLLAEAGYGLMLTEDVDGAPIDPGAHYRYRPEYGPSCCAEPAWSGLDRDSGVAVSGETLLALAAAAPQPLIEPPQWQAQAAQESPTPGLLIQEPLIQDSPTQATQATQATQEPLVQRPRQRDLAHQSRDPAQNPLTQEPHRGEARRLLRCVIDQRLGGRRLRSRELWRSGAAAG
ncbi:DNA repair protein RecO [Halorhodospira abdelmalekii]|uniref:DNA repair protein RecO n=1 Tax=Halorhodospira abdelmalekii TaxID=421629 RepID=UPI001904736D|nr:DNA repair protein RecO [Halorhodospira abdelmalekii]MBK1734794.1 DNA repair protein RecO [Halorhodospira abdelmalekii]